jgi:membrane associated rhomboid family serine protease
MSYRPYSRPGLNPIWVIIGVCTVIMIATVISPSAIYNSFGLVPAQIGSEPWTLLTYMFVHGGIWHLVTNMITLYFFGSFVMTLVGETKFLTTYFVGGIMGGLFFVLFAWLFGPSNSVVVGASGAIYALGGVLVAMRPNVKVMTFPLPVQIPLWAAVLFGFLILSFMPGIAWQAHLGGLVYGLAIGYYFRRQEYRRYY